MSTSCQVGTQSKQGKLMSTQLLNDPYLLFSNCITYYRLGLSYNESQKYEVRYYRPTIYLPQYPGENLEGLEKRSPLKSEQLNSRTGLATARPASTVQWCALLNRAYNLGLALQNGANAMANQSQLYVLLRISRELLPRILP